MIVKDDFCYAAKRRLDEKGMKQEDLAPLLGITPASVSYVLTGKCGLKARIKHIPEIARILGIEELPGDVAKGMSGTM